MLISTKKFIGKHLISGKLAPARRFLSNPTRTLTQDATGTLAYLQFEKLDVSKVKTELSVSYVTIYPANGL